MPSKVIKISKEKDFINVGEIIATKGNFMKGHGVTMDNNGNLIASIAGFVKKNR